MAKTKNIECDPKGTEVDVLLQPPRYITLDNQNELMVALAKIQNHLEAIEKNTFKGF